MVCLCAPLLAQTGRTVLDEAEWIDGEGSTGTHNFQGNNYDYAKDGEKWVNTLGKEDSWFSYDLSTKGADLSRPLYLACLFNNVDYGTNRETVIYANDVPVVERLEKPAQYAHIQSTAHFLLPAACWKNADGTAQETVTIRIEGLDGCYSMGFCGVSLVQGAEYEFHCTDWTRVPDRLAEGELTYDEVNNCLVAKKTGTNNVGLALKKEVDGNYVVPVACKYLVVRGEGLSTAAGASAIWWLNGRNANSSEYPIWTHTTEDGITYLVWDVTQTRISSNLVGNPFTLSSLGSDFSTIFGLTSSNEDGSATIYDINFYSLTGLAGKYPDLASAMGLSLLDESEETCGAVAEGKPVGMKRVLKPFVWNTFCVPFDMDGDLLKANRITEVRALSGVKPGSEVTTLTFGAVDKVEAGVPYIVKVDDNVSELNVDAAAQVTTEPVAQNPIEGIAMVGNFGKMTISNGEFFISRNAFYYADTNVTVKGFRAYITDATGAEVNRMTIDIDGNATAIEDATGAQTADMPVDVYTLSGVRVKKGVCRTEALDGLSKGIYIVNGKKLMK